MGPSEALATGYEFAWCRNLGPKHYELVVHFNKVSVYENRRRRWRVVNCKDLACRSSGFVFLLWKSE